MDALVSFAITLGTGLALALAWIGASSLRSTYRMSYPLPEPHSDTGRLGGIDESVRNGDDR